MPGFACCNDRKKYIVHIWSDDWLGNFCANRRETLKTRNKLKRTKQELIGLETELAGITYTDGAPAPTVRWADCEVFLSERCLRA